MSVQSDGSATLQPARKLFPVFIVLVMACAWLLVDAVLPLYGLWFHTALLTKFGQWVLLPTHVIFPDRALSPTLLYPNSSSTAPPVLLSLKETGLLFGTFVLLLLSYLLALRYLPQKVTLRFIVYTTLLLGIICLCIPVVTSPDLYSYIIYARMQVFYHLNPLATIPRLISHDPTYPHLYWIDQPSAYGPTWIMITAALQWLLSFHTTAVAPMVLALRTLGLFAHLGSVLLIWSIAGSLQRLHNAFSPQLRLQATLAFAWNPLLLFEACVNAHNDTILLLLLLLSLWLLIRQTTLTMAGAIVLLAVATSLKINIALFLPGVLLFLWTKPQRLQRIGLTLALYGLVIVLLYAPFWQNGAALVVLHTNPATYRTINTPAEFLTHTFNSILHLFGYPPGQPIGSPAENVLHAGSIALFALLFAFYCARAALPQHRLHTPLRLLRWMTVIWFLYCAIGTPWFWPWYMITFYGLFALLEAVDMDSWSDQRRSLNIPLMIRLCAFSMLSLYCFFAVGLTKSTVPYFSDFYWTYARGFWIWLIPLVPCLWYFSSVKLSKKYPHIVQNK